MISQDHVMLKVAEWEVEQGLRNAGHDLTHFAAEDISAAAAEWLKVQGYKVRALASL